MNYGKVLNLSGKSDIIEYEESIDSITVYFSGCHKYLYNNIKLGIQIIETMKKLANQGSGLNTNINQFVKGNFFEKSM